MPIPPPSILRGGASALLSMPVRLVLPGSGHGRRLVGLHGSLTLAPPAVKLSINTSTRAIFERFALENICRPEPYIPARRFHADAVALRCK